jgi:eukaryotic-like serine/threonine-protein kinase
MILALSLARSGRIDEAERLANEVSQEAPLDTTVQMYLVPTVRAAVKLQQHDPAAAIDLLRETVPYDLAVTNSFDHLYPAYIRGLAYLESGDGRAAAREFQKLIDNPGLCRDFITGPLARLQLGRAQRLMGDNASAQILRRIPSHLERRRPRSSRLSTGQSRVRQAKKSRQPRAMTP